MGFRFSGHETFPCRYAWLPKAFAEIQETPDGLADDTAAMISLGIGKNMVRSLRFWLQASGIATGRRDGTFQVTEFGSGILGANGADPFLEDIRTLWLLHWQIATALPEPLFAWDFLLHKWPQPEFSRSSVMTAFRRESRAEGKKLSDVTLEQHFEVFLHTYVPTRARKGEVLEDNLDCPLVELELIQKVGERGVGAEGGGREPVYAFRLAEKPDITPALFLFCLNDFWLKRRAKERTISLRDVTLAAGSPGQVLKLPEFAIRERLDRLEADSSGLFSYRESAALQQVTRSGELPASLLSRVYRREVVHA